MKTVQDLLAATARVVEERPDTMGYLGVVTTIRALANHHHMPELAGEAMTALHQHLGYVERSHVALDLARWSRIRTVPTVVHELQQAAEAAGRLTRSGGEVR